MTGEAFFGELKKGCLKKISIDFSKRLVSNQSNIFQKIQGYCSFEAAVGLNGVLWVKAADCNNTIIVMNAILNSENMD